MNRIFIARELLKVSRLICGANIDFNEVKKWISSNKHNYDGMEVALEATHHFLDVLNLSSVEREKLEKKIYDLAKKVVN